MELARLKDQRSKGTNKNLRKKEGGRPKAVFSYTSSAYCVDRSRNGWERRRREGRDGELCYYGLHALFGERDGGKWSVGETGRGGGLLA